jgi:hypothetical protein
LAVARLAAGAPGWTIYARFAHPRRLRTATDAGTRGPRHRAGAAMSNQFTIQTYEPFVFPDIDPIGQLSTTLLSGVLCGLLPLAVSISRGRPDWGLRTLGLCFLAGILKGYWLAAPVALAMTGVILTANPKAKAKWNLLTGWQPEAVVPTENQAPSQTPDLLPPALLARAAPIPAAPTPSGPPAFTTPAAPAIGKPQDSGAMAMCSACAAPILPCGDRMPPWCPKCGADYRAAKPA